MLVAVADGLGERLLGEVEAEMGHRAGLERPTLELAGEVEVGICLFVLHLPEKELLGRHGRLRVRDVALVHDPQTPSLRRQHHFRFPYYVLGELHGLRLLFLQLGSHFLHVE